MFPRFGNAKHTPIPTIAPSLRPPVSSRDIRVFCHVLLAKQQVRKVVILPQDALAAFQSVPVLCLNSMADGLCSARDFHNVKVRSAATSVHVPNKIVSRDVYDPVLYVML